MRISIEDPKGPHYYFAEVTERWAEAHNNYALVSCGLTVEEDLSRASLEWLRRNGRLKEITFEQWNHSGCQSSCTLRGGASCRW